jgi:hypothetical protein
MDVEIHLLTIKSASSRLIWPTGANGSVLISFSSENEYSLKLPAIFADK